MKKLQTVRLSQIPQLARKIALQLKGGEIIALVGNLGSGKTTFAKALGKRLKVKQRMTSPTFTLMNSFLARLPMPVKNNLTKFKKPSNDKKSAKSAKKGYGGQARLLRPAKRKIYLYHLDLYRTKSFGEIKALGLTEIWGKKDTVTLIEWADKIKRHLPKKTLVVKFFR